uniref:DDE Tnp4 domain-containing protein n=1 Tax=Lactuca sativa TaxID=4236 RepID=A0A9R1VZJ4_LACSA|nr:hypothetical protein LSAT_V11C400227530 [Lactuca sativa]
MTPLQFQNNSNPNGENVEGKGDSDDINLEDDVEPLFPSFHESSSSKKKRMDSDDSNSSNDNEEWWVEEDREFKMLCGLALKGIILARNLCADLATNYGLQQTRNISIKHFHTVLEVVLKLSVDIIKPDANYNDDVLEYILSNPQYYPMFKNCIGAVDGTHVRASVPQNEEAKYIDKYYIVDAGYPNTRGYLAPHKGTNIHYYLPDFRRGHSAAVREPHGPKDKFNYLHSSLRNIIEQTFGEWKARWTLLRDMHVNYKYKNQVKIMIASMAIHNYIRKLGRFDEEFNRAQQESYNLIRGDTSSEFYEEGPSTRRTSDNDLYMAAIRDIIAQDINTLRRRM